MNNIFERFICGDAAEQLRTLNSESVYTCVTSPPYFNLRDYGVSGQLGREDTPEEYVEKLAEVFREVRRVLHPNGTLWLNLGDSYTSGGRKTRDNSPTLDEDKLHSAIVATLNEFGAIRAEVKADVLELAELAQSGGKDGGESPLTLQARLKELSAEQAVLLDKVLADMKNKELNAQLKVVLDEKQDILERIAAQEQDEEQRAAQASRQREMEEWLDQQPLCFTEYDDTLTRRFVEQVTVVDAETIRVKIRDAGIEIERKLC